jgi:hypothetical protein
LLEVAEVVAEVVVLLRIVVLTVVAVAVVGVEVATQQILPLVMVVLQVMVLHTVFQETQVQLALMLRLVGVVRVDLGIMARTVIVLHPLAALAAQEVLGGLLAEQAVVDLVVMITNLAVVVVLVVKLLAVLVHTLLGQEPEQDMGVLVNAYL